ncbi:GNAT family N-acetyltransferase [Vibrio cidicii]|uniref:GNAT family N-acetyltransferase n=1 Tax=Vibrio cidicii TaxID=1763883 RepID=UPI0018C1DAB8|nr:GNAT family N-acetyltransferase [Vibrio cidicii]MBG0758306.1 GNAT family N-acetyltransferase [Vibrio cidicii]
MQKLILPDGLHVRPSRPTDKPFIENLHREVRQDLQLIEGEQDFIESIVEMQFRAQTQGYGDQFPNAMYFIIEKHHEPIGKATLDFGSNEVRLIDLAFLPKACGLGFGQAVIQSFQKAAAQVGAPMTLSVLRSNIGAKQLYHRLGFELEASKPPYELLIWYPPAIKRVIGG